MICCDICELKIDGRATVFSFSNLHTANDNHKLELCGPCASKLEDRIKDLVNDMQHQPLPAESTP